MPCPPFTALAPSRHKRPEADAVFDRTEEAEWVVSSSCWRREPRSSRDGSWAGHARRDVERRVSAAILGLADVYAPGPVAVVAHDAVNRCALARLVPGLGNADGIVQRTGCWNRLEHHCSGWTATIVDGVPDDGRRP